MKYCCKAMECQLGHGDKSPEAVIRIGKGGTYSLAGKGGFYRCTYCPWCGIKLKQTNGKGVL